ncbi:putative bifunctional diguanylate cyclase/phosphodiesterase [Pseudooceanicola algae]|uniref:Putative signaling protein n=1 Tax=Pseudooceanicola algae TaxID=1537215 RepID=A0A418SKR3_9RHOB|nr:GGDEF and EAL domain-containing protein [Pseudooceanicola algae]QPM90751.1 putative signaling protein [Pseudooceanicola algae]
MFRLWRKDLSSFLTSLRRVLSRPRMLALLPALCLLAYFLAGELALILVALTLPVVLMLVAETRDEALSPPRPRDAVTGLGLRDSLERSLDHALHLEEVTPRKTACLMVQIDDFDVFIDRYGQAAGDNVLARTATRLHRMLRDGDQVCKTGPAVFGISIAPVTQLDLEEMIQMAARLQTEVEEPLSLDATTVYVSCSIGFCLGARSPGPTGSDLVTATQTALSEAMRFAPSAIRSFSTDMRKRQQSRSILADEVAAALESDQFLPFFQPQVSCDTGLVTGFEALARWCHPDRGIISPAEFLPVVEQSGQMERLGDVMLVQALTALRRWDDLGLKVPQVGVNFATEELRNPRLMEKVRWQLDRFGLTPDRLSVEVLETVVAASPEDVVSRNINSLAAMGCRIDLDDFGTGHASISSIRRFSVERLKIDRSFVMKVDRDIEQQRMVSAILTMAERLGLATLAEGVETQGEHAMLAQLGCDHVQGYEIARPMPFDQTAEWIRLYHAGLIEAPKFGRGTGTGPTG